MPRGSEFGRQAQILEPRWPPAAVRGSQVPCKLLMGYLWVAGGHLHPSQPRPRAGSEPLLPLTACPCTQGISPAYLLPTVPSSRPRHGFLCLELFLSFFTFTGGFRWFFKALLEGALLLQQAFSAVLCPPRQDGVATGVFAQVFGAALSTLCSSVPSLFPSKGSKVGLCLIDLWVSGLSLGLARMEPQECL